MFHTDFDQVFFAYVSIHLPVHLLLTRQIICFFSTYSPISNKRKKGTIGLSHIAPQNQTCCFNYLIAQKL